MYIHHIPREAELWSFLHAADSFTEILLKYADELAPKNVDALLFFEVWYSSS